MGETNKTQRFFHLFSWLSKRGHEGILKDSVIEEYGISEKTFHRDVEEISKIFPFFKISYDSGTRRLFGDVHPFGNLAKTEENASIQMSDDKIFRDIRGKLDIFKKPLEKNIQTEDTFFLHIEDAPGLKITSGEMTILLESVLKKTLISFEHKSKLKRGIPLFICYYTQRWYLFLLTFPGKKVYKYRFDLIGSVAKETLRNPVSLPDEEDIIARRNYCISKIKKSYNIFVDLNSEKNIEIKLRFFFPQSYVVQEIHSVSSVKAVDNGVTDVVLTFSGYDEARMFFNKWLGVFQILEPENLRQRYIDDLEDALGIL